ncbi:unnamed protein product [Didymodactylos carnosus]|uniref:Glycosyltransferase 61 catalytic domain-containing protein n=2 Tax=Didymodactylos carnosus TaxID=1234261 RepID=A0A8S2R915_9BILA|nr:unnamed protein product [Didymodactylos carnosus]CAF4149858.1 unnamed protein product [Didymodactylos carnosus]
MQILAVTSSKEALTNRNMSIITNLYQNTTSSSIAIKYFQESKRYSKFRCTGHENNIDSWIQRLCVFNHICYNTNLQRYEYFRRADRKKPVFFDSGKGMLTDFGQKFLSLSIIGGSPWAPFVVDEALPTANITLLNRLHTLWQNYFPNNVGHLLWEEFGTIHYSMERMNELDTRSVVMHWSPISKDPLYLKYQDHLLSAITPEKMVESKPYINSFNTRYVCFDRLMAGGMLRFFDPSLYDKNQGRETLIYNWRSKLIKHHGFDPDFVPTKHHIILTNKSHSLNAKSNSIGHRAIANMQAIEEFIRKTYPTISFEVVEWHKIPFPKQIEMLIHTTILITPSGGVSTRAPFLPRGAHAIIMDYYVLTPNQDVQRGYSGTLEGEFHNYFPHYIKDYYQIYGTQDFVWDYPGASDSRNDASIIVNMTRLSFLIEKALEDMQP